MRTGSPASPAWIWHDIEALLRRDFGVDDDTFKGSAKDIYNLFIQQGWTPPDPQPIGVGGHDISLATGS